MKAPTAELRFLDGVEDRALSELVSFALGPSVGDTVGLSRDVLYGLLFSFKGYGILQVQAVRRAILRTASLETLRGLATDDRDAEGNTVFDVAHALSLRQLKGNWAQRFSAHFGIPLRFFLSENEEKAEAAWVTPIKQLPPLFPYQQEVLDELSIFLESSSASSALLQIPTGGGKTRVAMEAVANALLSAVDRSGTGRVLWLAHTEELCEQAIQAFERIWKQRGDSAIRIHRCWGRSSFGRVQGARLVVSSYSKAVSLIGKEGSTPEREFDLIVVDEAHRALGEEIHRTLRTMKQAGAKLMGLTATPGRNVEQPWENRGLAKLFQGHRIWPRSLGPDAVMELQKLGILSRVDHRTAPYIEGAMLPVGVGEGGDYSSKTLVQLAADERRNAMIVEKVSELVVRENHAAIVFACSVEHSKKIAVGLVRRGIRAASLDYDVPSSHRSYLAEALRGGGLDVIVNFGILSTGFDAPRITAVVITRPTTSLVLYSQMIGRGLRGPRTGGTEKCVVLDITDNPKLHGSESLMYDFFSEYWTEGKK